MNEGVKDVVEFKCWIEKEGLAQGKVISDVASRANRVARMIRIDKKEDTEVLLLGLEKNAAFSDLSPSVKSQLKKACRLYRQYKGL
ncbi:MAG: hypothetical protein JEY79_12835 [Pseudodesulfovibrio sp.]|nr:hypothetical protein [Pseudodesulfovibrio sp.]